MILTVQLIRHGISIANKLELCYGATDVELCDEGIIELKEKRYSINYLVTDHYYTTGMKRTNQTLDLLFDKKPEETFDELREWNFGDFEMRHHKDMEVECPEYNKWVWDTTGDCCPPNGESLNSFKKRIDEGFKHFVEYLIDNNISSSTLVCHGGTIGEVLTYYFDQDALYYDILPKPGMGYVLTIEVNEDRSFKVIESKVIS